MDNAKKDKMEERVAELRRKYNTGAASRAKGGGPGGGPGGPGGPGMGALGGKPKSMGPTIMRLMGYLRPDFFLVVVSFSFVIVGTLANLAGSYMLRPIINNFITPTDGSPGDPRGLFLGLCAMAVVYLLATAANYLQARVMMVVAQNALVKLRADLFTHLEKLPVKYFDQNHHGDVMSRFTNDIDTVGMMLSQTFAQLFSGLLSLVGTFVLMAYTSIWLTLISVVLIPLMLKVVQVIGGRSRDYARSSQAALGAVNGYIEEMIAGQKVIKVFNHEDVANEEFGMLNEDLREKQMQAQFMGAAIMPMMGNISQLNYAVTACVGGLLCIFRSFDVGGLTVFLNFSRQFSRPINEISMQVINIFSALAGAERVFNVMDQKPEEPDVPGAKAPDPIQGFVRLSDVHFGYKEGEEVLKGISLYAKPGQKIALVGSTGAGKTTITNLVNRFYDIWSGSITIDDVDIMEWPRDELRRHVTMILQDTHLFSSTVMENIRYGRLDATDEEVIQTAKMVSAHSFIHRLPHGYQTMLEGDGANLSQGQRQLLNIARAAISQAPILILDEATSSVDTRTEKLIDRGMDKLMSERTTLVIAHRLSTVRNANAIMVLEHGEIIERGDHDELLAQKGRYYELYTGAAELD
ncbi:MAG: ABC transporter ATP-binding protein/permease [Lachnospiraceae bacterium]|jgi:ATP-binding cassette subfamily B protein|nr:ABC transporter ATP-binding protein/permease [Lachnospiraceae bacterium]